MTYIIAGANLSNRDAPGTDLRADTARGALEKIAELQASGYHVRVSNSNGDDVLISDLQALAASDGDQAPQDRAPDPLSGSF